MYNNRLSLSKIQAHRAPTRSLVPSIQSLAVPGLVTLLTIDLLLFALLILRILEIRG